MHKRLITALMAMGILFSFAACDLFNGLVNKQTEATTTTTEVETTTTAEETTTTEETTTEETTEETSEETTSEETTSEETTTVAPTKKPTKKPTKVPVKPTYIPKGWYKDMEAWGTKYKGKKVYVIYKGSNSGNCKGWWKGKWVKLYEVDKTLHNYEDDDHQYCEIRVTFYRDKNHKYKYASYITD